MDTTWVALLRGINVGGRKPVPMSELRALFECLGHRQVSTYVQSGNVVFRTDGEEPALVAGLESALRETFGFDATVVMRSGDELALVARTHPFAANEPDPAKLHVFFLGDAPERGGRLSASRRTGSRPTPSSSWGARPTCTTPTAGAARR